MTAGISPRCSKRRSPPPITRALRRAVKLSRKRGKLRGIGIGCYLELLGGVLEEAATIAFPGGGAVHVGIGSSSSGQGHATVFGRLVAERLGVPEQSVHHPVRGIPSRDVPGFGAVASRSTMLVGGAISNGIDAVLAKARKAAALLLQAKEAELAFHDGHFEFPGSAQRISLFDVAARVSELVRQGVLGEGLDTKGEVKTGPSFPNGCHVAEVEIDPDTGATEIVSYVAVDDRGRVLDPVLVAGQIHGGVAQGLGQAVCEATVYDADSGQALAGSFMDYAIPRAGDVPAMTVLHHEVVCDHRPARRQRDRRGRHHRRALRHRERDSRTAAGAGRGSDPDAGHGAGGMARAACAARGRVTSSRVRDAAALVSQREHVHHRARVGVFQFAAGRSSEAPSVKAVVLEK